MALYQYYTYRTKIEDISTTERQICNTAEPSAKHRAHQASE